MLNKAITDGREDRVDKLLETIKSARDNLQLLLLQQQEQRQAQTQPPAAGNSIMFSHFSLIFIPLCISCQPVPILQGFCHNNKLKDCSCLEGKDLYSRGHSRWLLL